MGPHTTAESAHADHSAADIRQLAAGTEVIVDTLHTKYRLLIVDGPAGRVWMQGGRMFQETTEAWIEGTRTEDQELLNGVIRVGLGFDFIVWHQRGRTAPVQSFVIGAPCVSPDIWLARHGCCSGS